MKINVRYYVTKYIFQQIYSTIEEASYLVQGAKRNAYLFFLCFLFFFLLDLLDFLSVLSSLPLNSLVFKKLTKKVYVIAKIQIFMLGCTYRVRQSDRIVKAVHF